jgi:selenocysteine lyase/cysteine desulfurase
VPYERGLVSQLLDGLAQIPQVHVRGIVDPQRLAERLPTVAFTYQGLKSIDVASALGRQGFFVWHGNYYALPLTERLGLEPDGMVRVGMVHYNTSAEIDDLLAALQHLH